MTTPDLLAALQETLALSAQGENEQAIQKCALLVQQAPKDFNVLHLMGVLLYQQKQYAKALPYFEAALSQHPTSFDAQLNYARTLQTLGRWPQTLASAQKLIHAQRQRFEGWHVQAYALRQLGQIGPALVSYDQATRCAPGNDALFVEWGIALKECGQFNAAQQAFERALQLNPQNAHAHFQLGLLWRQTGHAPQALQAYERALALNPQDNDTRINRANLLRDQWRYEEALAEYNYALRLQPQLALGYLNRGALYGDMQRYDKAIADYQTALQLNPQLSDARLNLGLSRLLLGQLEAGWPDYESRWEAMASAKRQFEQPRWQGPKVHPLAGKTLLVYAEQGLGDTLNFCRYVHALAAMGAHVILEVQAPLSALLEQLSPAAQIITRGQSLPTFDYHCALLSLPGLLGTTLPTIPSFAQGYLHSLPARTRQWKTRLKPIKSPRIGLVWQGSLTNTNNHNRSIALSEMLRLVQASPKKLRWASLQKDLTPQDQAQLADQKNLLDLGPELNDFADTAAALERLDLVITVDTSIAHLAGAMNKPTWLLLPLAPDWRWLLHRSDSPWYPSLRLFRQTSANQWGPVIDDVIAALQDL